MTTDPTTEFFRALFGGTEGTVEIRACANDVGGAPAKPHFSRDMGTINVFLQRHDQDGFGLFVGCCTRKTGSTTGKRADLHQAPAVWLDIDCRKLGIPVADALKALRTCRLPASIVVKSGNGVHGYWLLKEPVDVTEIGGADEEQLVGIMKLLAGVFAGDMKCAELARILRLPGTHNSKEMAKAANEGKPILCELSWANTSRRYDPMDLEDWLNEQRPLLEISDEARRKLVAANSDAALDPTDPFVRYAKEAGWKPPIDVAAALAAMTWGGTGETSIHDTQRSVTASLVSRGGVEVEQIVEMVMNATIKAAGLLGSSWNWKREEKKVRGLVDGAIKRFGVRPGNVTQLRPVAAAAGGAATGVGEHAGAVAEAEGGGNVVAISDAPARGRKKKGVPPADGGEAAAASSDIEEVAGAVLLKWREERGPLITVEGVLWTYEEGLWRRLDNDADEHDLAVEVHGMASAMRKRPTTGFINSVISRVRHDPGLRRRRVKFDAHGLIVGTDVAIDPTTGEVHELSPELYATWRVEAAIATPTPVTAWLEYLETSLSDRQPEDRAGMIGALQEWFGAGLIKNKPRELRKALIVHGPKRTGKTRIPVVFAAMLGGSKRCAKLRVSDLGEKFGMEALVGAAAWVRDDGIGEGDELDAESFKTIVTGEGVSITRKNRTMWEGSLDIPVMLTANNMPKLRDKSAAAYERMMMFPMTVQRPEDRPETWISEDVMNQRLLAELPGIVHWAIEGWRRLLKRRRFVPPGPMLAALRDLERANNPIGSWAEACLVADEYREVHVRDLLASLNGWYTENYGSSGRGASFTGKSLWQVLRVAFPTISERKTNGKIVAVGIKLNDEGLAAWEFYAGLYEGKNWTHAPTRDDVNRPTGASSGKEPLF
jgi:P4 family phage/plasmid primase-like protien